MACTGDERSNGSIFFSAPAEPAGKIGVDSFKILPSKLSQTVGGGHFFRLP
jgi:hypothetical protein